MKIDELGRAVDCFAFNNTGHKTKCNALVDFYNNRNEKSSMDDYTAQCYGCPFYKKKNQMKTN